MQPLTWKVRTQQTTYIWISLAEARDMQNRDDPVHCSYPWKLWQNFEYFVLSCAINQSINVYSSKQPTGFSNRWRLAEPLVEHITIGAGVDMHKQENIIYRDYARWVQEPQTDLQTHPEPMEINSAKENREKDPKQPAGRGNCTQPPPWQPGTFCLKWPKFCVNFLGHIFAIKKLKKLRQTVRKVWR